MEYVWWGWRGCTYVLSGYWKNQVSCLVETLSTSPAMETAFHNLFAPFTSMHPHTQHSASEWNTSPYEMLHNFWAEATKRLTTSPSRQRVLSQEAMIAIILKSATQTLYNFPGIRSEWVIYKGLSSMTQRRQTLCYDWWEWLQKDKASRGLNI